MNNVYKFFHYCIVYDIFIKNEFWISRKKVIRRVKKLNPLSNTRAMLRLNPYAAVLKRAAVLTAKKRQQERELLLAEKRGVSLFFNTE